MIETILGEIDEERKMHLDTMLKWYILFALKSSSLFNSSLFSNFQTIQVMLPKENIRTQIKNILVAFMDDY